MPKYAVPFTRSVNLGGMTIVEANSLDEALDAAYDKIKEMNTRDASIVAQSHHLNQRPASLAHDAWP